MNKFSRELVQGMQEAAAFVEGKKVGARVHVVEVPDVRAIRQRLHMSQQRFAETCGHENVGLLGRWLARGLVRDLVRARRRGGRRSKRRPRRAA